MQQLELDLEPSFNLDTSVPCIGIEMHEEGFKLVTNMEDMQDVLMVMKEFIEATIEEPVDLGNFSNATKH